MLPPLVSTAPAATFTRVVTSDREPANTTEATLAAPVFSSVSPAAALVMPMVVLDAATRLMSSVAESVAPEAMSTDVVPAMREKPALRFAALEPSTCSSAPAERSAMALMLRSLAAASTAVSRTFTVALPVASV